MYSYIGEINNVVFVPWDRDGVEKLWRGEPSEVLPKLSIKIFAHLRPAKASACGTVLPLVRFDLSAVKSRAAVMTIRPQSMLPIRL